ncbi:MAG TPA: hypothetical protein VFB38_17715, partial [Chthonomonadaceae bacterium]|nr:hypothetical protein [Chthonomonadaceae bacterium]
MAPDSVQRDIHCVRYTPAGQVFWAGDYGSPLSERDAAHALAIDRRDFAIVAGQSFGSGTNDIVALK